MENKMGYGKGTTYDAVTIEPGLTVARLIFRLSKSLEASDGQAIILGLEIDTQYPTLCIKVNEGGKFRVNDDDLNKGLR